MTSKFLKQFDEAHEIAGWLGMVLILAAYFLVSFEFLLVKDAFYQVLNVLGSLGIIYNTTIRKAYPSVVLNVIWISIGAVALLQMF